MKSELSIFILFLDLHTSFVQQNIIVSQPFMFRISILCRTTLKVPPTNIGINFQEKMALLYYKVNGGLFYSYFIHIACLNNSPFQNNPYTMKLSYKKMHIVCKDAENNINFYLSLAQKLFKHTTG